MDLQLNGKKALVTGASQGLGRAIAKALAAEGVTIFATARNPELLASLVSEIEATGGATPIIFEQDFVAEDGPQRIADAALAALGHVDILINNAGGSRPMDIDAPEEHWVEGMTLNFDRHRQLTQKLLPNFLERKSGAIISLSGNLEPEVVNAAMVAKAGLVVWSKGLSEQLGQHGITVNCVQPGLIDTAQIRRLYPGEDLVAKVIEITGGNGARVVLDPVGGPSFEPLTASMARGGILLQYGALSSEPTPFPLFTVLGKSLTLKGYLYSEVISDDAILERAKSFIVDGLTSGALKPVIARTFPLDQVQDAHRFLESNEQIGKVVVTV